MAATKEDAHWQIQEAKQRFSELIRSVQSEGPQFVTKHGEEIAVVIDIEEYHRLHPASRPETFKEWLMSGPKLDDDRFIDMLNERQRDYTTEEDLNIFDDMD